MCVCVEGGQEGRIVRGETNSWISRHRTEGRLVQRSTVNGQSTVNPRESERRRERSRGGEEG